MAHPIDRTGTRFVPRVIVGLCWRRIKYKGGPLTPAFNSLDMVVVIETHQPALWVYGHTHECTIRRSAGPGSFQINSDIPATLAVLNARILMKRVCQSR
jgi:hypothetical protein